MKRRLISRRVIGMFVVAGLGATAILAYQPIMAVVAVGGGSAQADPVSGGTDVPQSVIRYREAFLADRQPPQRLAPLGSIPCEDGHAGPFPCENIDLMALLPLSTFGAGSGSDVWGWTDRLTGKEYALMALDNGVGFVDISNPASPVYLGKLPAASSPSAWTDVETYENFAFVVKDATGNQGMQIFDLTRLRDVPNPPVTFDEDAHYSGFATAHTITIDTQTGFAFANGSNTCGGGPHMVNIRDPLNPRTAGCNSVDGYTHDSQCVIYQGPDVEYQGREICFNSNEDTLTIVDVTNKDAPREISRTPYSGSGYTHQGWLSPNHQVFVLNDELDEIFFDHNYWTRFWNVRNLDRTSVRFIYKSPDVPAIDHNLFVRGNFVYESNYRSGLRILGAPGVEVAYFDVYPDDDQPAFNGTWSNYPFYASGLVVISGIEQGLFVVKPNPPPGNPDWLG
jgi:choice-of-anchor B domain-containing protein